MRRSAGPIGQCSSGTAGNITAYSAYTGGDLGTLGSGSRAQRLAYRHAEQPSTSAVSFNTLNLTGAEGSR